MEFAERMLKKYGWDADKGLGKDNQGMKAAIKPVLKFDNRGVGCNQKDEYSSEFKWWEYSYNRAAQKIAASQETEEEKAKDKDTEKKNKKRKHDESETESPEKSIYSRFEKGSVLMGNKEESLRTDQETVITEISSVMPSDEELLRICGGRTAHKGARHGIKMNGKLQRLQEQEQQRSNSPDLSVVPDVEKKKKKKKKKHKSVDSNE